MSYHLVVGLRERNRRAAMRETQRAALRLFRARGFEAVTVEDIAAEVGIAPSTIFRHFGTKEALVLWDEHDASVEAELVRRLPRQPPLAALRAAFVQTLGGRYADDHEFQRDRVQFIYQTQALHAAAVERQLADQAELTQALTEVLPAADRLAAPLLSGAAMLALDVAIDRWQQGGGRENLSVLLDDAFETLRRLDQIR
ncbi:MAG: hypothetical protein CSA58_11115 [Micrococcales bacterium]|nr:MAG: hypothetical protein CSA58_11115 [Micrococcales bacterium]